MKIKVAEIPAGGKRLEFLLDVGALNQLLDAAREQDMRGGAGAVAPPRYIFVDKPKAAIQLAIEGTTISVEGSVVGRFSASCARCLEDSEREISSPLKIVVKPLSERAQLGSQDEDLSVAYYDPSAGELDCTELVRDYLILGLPYVVLCAESCKGLCLNCGVNLNETGVGSGKPGQCKRCAESDEGESENRPFSALKKLIH